MADYKPTDVGDRLRIEFAFETAQTMTAHLVAFSIYLGTGDVKAARNFWECARLCGKSISVTLDELDGGGN